MSHRERSSISISLVMGMCSWLCLLAAGWLLLKAGWPGTISSMALLLPGIGLGALGRGIGKAIDERVGWRVSLFALAATALACVVLVTVWIALLAPVLIALARLYACGT